MLFDDFRELGGANGLIDIVVHPCRQAAVPSLSEIDGWNSYFVTRCAVLLLSVPGDVRTEPVPLIAPWGTVASISVSETTVNVAGVPFNVTLVDVYFASKYVPRESCGSSMF